MNHKLLQFLFISLISLQCFGSEFKCLLTNGKETNTITVELGPENLFSKMLKLSEKPEDFIDDLSFSCPGINKTTMKYNIIIRYNGVFIDLTLDYKDPYFDYIDYDLLNLNDIDLFLRFEDLNTISYIFSKLLDFNRYEIVINSILRNPSLVEDHSIKLKLISIPIMAYKQNSQGQASLLKEGLVKHQLLSSEQLLVIDLIIGKASVSEFRELQRILSEQPDLKALVNSLQNIFPDDAILLGLTSL
ncbi:hypothetical protein HBN50_13615 [Halobacteriovorax sp. GB3]|uniref:hypothetical protein n=1 Tax=Halobacteriovorax sp. GB3 TaxID=2719615 RepID=UPI00235E4987|nr:hypothetical protein [Halobacteriovorax sp. GB3]MDD0854145.1 hypothetical protein [Halobacteriovorax sp. GB3]